jgi:hypothetical protein
MIRIKTHFLLAQMESSIDAMFISHHIYTKRTEKERKVLL